MSSSLPAALKAIRQAMIEVIEGSSGTVRTVPAGAFKYAELVGFPVERVQQLAEKTRHGRNWFDIQFTRITDNASTPESAFGNRRLADVFGRIDVARYVLHRSTVEEGVSTTQRDEMLGELDDVVEALGWPDNLSVTLAGEETGIASGCISQRETTPLQEITVSFEQHLLRTQIVFAAVVEVVRTV